MSIMECRHQLLSSSRASGRYPLHLFWNYAQKVQLKCHSGVRHQKPRTLIPPTEAEDLPTHGYVFDVRDSECDDRVP